MKNENILLDNINIKFSHTSMLNATKNMPSDSKLKIFPESWSTFTNIFDNLLKNDLPEYTLGIYFGTTIHGIKCEWNTMSDSIIMVIFKLIEIIIQSID